MSKHPKKIAEHDRRNPGLKPKTWGNFQEYAELMRWLVPDVLRYCAWRLPFVMMLSVASVGARAATVGSVLLFVRSQARGNPVVVLGQELPSDATVFAFAFYGGAALGFALLDVGARMWSDRINFRLANSYAGAGMQLMLRHVAAGKPIDPPAEIALPSPHPLVGVMQVDVQRLARVVVQALSLPTPMITFVVVLGALLWLNAVLTLILLPLFGVYSLAVAAINRRMLRDSQRIRLAGRELNRDLQSIAGTLQRTRFPHSALPTWIASFPDKTWMARSIQTFGGIWFARRHVQYLRDAFNGISLLTIVMAFGTLLATSSDSWGIVLSYLVALGYGVQAMDKTSRQITAVNRQIPHVRRYVWFMQTHGVALRNVRTAATTTAQTSGPSLRLGVAGETYPHSRDELELVPGSVSYCAYDRELDSRSIGDLCLALAGGDDGLAYDLESRAFALSRITRLPERSIAAMLPPTNDDKRTRARVERFLEELGLRDEFDARIGNLKATVTDEIDNACSASLRYVLRLLPGIAAEPRITFLQSDTLAELEGADRARIISALRNEIVVLVPEDPSDPIPEGEKNVLLVADGALRGIGDQQWHEYLRREGRLSTPQWLIDARAAEKIRAASKADEDADDDDE